MSLDVYLYEEEALDLSSEAKICSDGQCYFIGEWNERFEPKVELILTGSRIEIWEGNITHNLAEMARVAGIYEYVWHPEGSSIYTALDVAPLLEDGLKNLQNDPEFFKQYNPSNGFGSYEYLVKFIRKYLAACIEHPNAVIEASR